ncbi:hypothetical protein MAIT1_04299 [Magnetofaba australis IT-1]|uniref:Uncharacterized protein n=2 Tax=Magnetofaba TaxID=1472292 RepID=A0A1Y2K5Y6_9PROT|nr:hypothetical protein MAIT1_04299 [Magnetofaba australis IT-1]
MFFFAFISALLVVGVAQGTKIFVDGGHHGQATTQVLGLFMAGVSVLFASVALFTAVGFLRKRAAQLKKLGYKPTLRNIFEWQRSSNLRPNGQPAASASGDEAAASK